MHTLKKKKGTWILPWTLQWFRYCCYCIRPIKMPSTSPDGA